MCSAICPPSRPLWAHAFKNLTPTASTVWRTSVQQQARGSRRCGMARRHGGLRKPGCIQRTGRKVEWPSARDVPMRARTDMVRTSSRPDTVRLHSLARMLPGAATIRHMRATTSARSNVLRTSTHGTNELFLMMAHDCGSNARMAMGKMACFCVCSRQPQQQRRVSPHGDVHARGQCA